MNQPIAPISIERPIERGKRAREKDPERDSFAERKLQVVIDVVTYRVVSVKNLVEERFGGNYFAARKGIDQMKRFERFHASGAIRRAKAAWRDASMGPRLAKLEKRQFRLMTLTDYRAGRLLGA